MNTMAHPILQQNGRGTTMASTAAARKVIVEFPEELLKQTEKAAAELSTDRSKLIRSAVEAFLENREKVQFEAELAEAYRANDELNREIAAEFDHVQAENY
jgi:metal-responsive CopG/Arc/MetJ family transcriptional regulator